MTRPANLIALRRSFAPLKMTARREPPACHSERNPLERRIAAKRLTVPIRDTDSHSIDGGVRVLATLGMTNRRPARVVIPSGVREARNLLPPLLGAPLKNNSPSARAGTSATLEVNAHE